MSSPDAARQLTARAIILSLILTVLLAAANAYLGLFAGLTVATAIPAAVVSMGVLRMLGRSSILENNIVATGASAGSSIAAGTIFTIPALVIMGHWTQLRILVGACDRRPRRPARRAVLRAAAPHADPRPETPVPRRRRDRRSAEGQRGPGPRPEVAGVRGRGGSALQARAVGPQVLAGVIHHRALLRRAHHRILRHQPVARTARCRLHRRIEHRRADALRRRIVLVDLHSLVQHLHVGPRPRARGASSSGFRPGMRPT